jgi:16S rRNA (guanine527-N7)-methyltransferase
MTPHMMPGLDVSRETQARLDGFVALILHWTDKINLIAPGTRADIWARHMADSAQILTHANPGAPALWADLGSGGGFPGLVIAIILHETRPDDRVVLIESDQRKAAFLRIAAAQFAPTARVESVRIEDLAPIAADFVLARALAPLPVLIPLVHRHLAPHGRAILHKGERHQDEIASLSTDWTMNTRVTQSQTDPRAAIVTIDTLAQVTHAR